jgi:sugar phosphate isomerase/epimerase
MTKHIIDRRRFLAASGSLAVAGLALGTTASPAAPAAPGAPPAEKLGWRLGCQASSFNRFTFFEALEKNASLGLRFLEAYPGQRLSKAKPDVKLDHHMSPDDRATVKKRLAELHTRLVCYGVVGLSKDEKASRKVFDFAKDMGIEVIVSEPPEDAFDTIEKLCDEYQISVAIHNHPKPSHYWNPDTVLAVCKGRGRRIGACADTGHWMRSAIKPLEAIRKLEGRIVSFHFKDLNTFGPGAHDVPWGTGQANVKEILKEVRRQGIKAPFSIEYEYNWDNSVPEIAQCVACFEKIAAELAG